MRDCHFRCQWTGWISARAVARGGGPRGGSPGPRLDRELHLDEAVWDPAAGKLDPAVIDGADAVINLNGRSIAKGRWNSTVKEELRSSRLDSTKTLAQAIGNSEYPPGLLINASAVGYYGDRGDEMLEESSSIGEGFLAELSRDWEGAALAARSERTRSLSCGWGWWWPVEVPSGRC